jgi:hypothetical protein
MMNRFDSDHADRVITHHGLKLYRVDTVAPRSPTRRDHRPSSFEPGEIEQEVTAPRMGATPTLPTDRPAPGPPVRCPKAGSRDCIYRHDSLNSVVEEYF